MQTASSAIPSQPVLPRSQAVLEYASGSVDRVSRWPSSAFVLAGIPGVICPFISFTSDTSPASVVVDYVQHLLSRTPMFLDNLILIAAPFFLAVVIWLRQIRLLIRSPATLAEHVIVLCLAAASICASGYILSFGFMDMLRRPIDARDISITAAGTMFLVCGFVTLVWRRKFPRDVLGSISLNTAYLTNAGMCLAGFFGDYDAGAWLALSTGVVLIIETMMLTRRSTRSAGAIL